MTSENKKLPTISDLSGLPAPVRLWIAPIKAALQVVSETSDKTVGELTMPEIFAWVTVGSYALLTGIVAGQIAANVAVTVFRGPGRR